MSEPITLFTMGFAGKSAEEFFGKLQTAGVQRLIDVRLYNVSQLAGFTKKKDLEYFLRAIAGIEYRHYLDLSPSPELFDAFKKKGEIDRPEYERRFKLLMRQRRPEKHHQPQEFDRACLLCTEPAPQDCHRHLVAEHLRRKWGGVSIVHL
jgi:uncharacterized protein (DUF488 family)